MSHPSLRPALPCRHQRERSLLFAVLCSLLRPLCRSRAFLCAVAGIGLPLSWAWGQEWEDITGSIDGGIPLVQNGGPLAADETTLYVNTGDGVSWTSDGGANFTRAADIDGGSWRFVKVVNGELWVGDAIASQHYDYLWRSADKGASWTSASAGMPGEVDLISTEDVTYDEIAGTYWAASRFGGVYRSDDGSNWTHTRVGLPQLPFVGYTAGEFVHARDGEAIVSIIGDGTITAGGLYRTDNDGASWSRIDGVPAGDPGNFVSVGGRLLMTTSGTSTLGGGLYFSDDNGETWTFQNQWLGTAYSLSTDGELLFAAIGGGIFYSANQGASWERIDSAGMPAGWNAVAIERVGDWLYLFSSENGQGRLYRKDVSGFGFPVSTQITLQPEGGTVIEENAISLSAAAIGAGAVSYQWYRDGQLLSGETGDTLTLDPIAEGDEGLYTVVATAGNGSVESTGAYVEVKERRIGTVDTQFAPGPAFRDVWSALVDSEGAVWYHGDFNYDGSHLVKLDPVTGEILAAVASSADGRSLAEDSEGKIWAGTNNAWLHRVSKDGSIDFTVDIKLGSGSGRVNAIAPYGDEGKVLIAGYFDTVGDVQTGPVALLNHDGTVDGSFDASRSSLSSLEIPDVEVGPNGEIYIVSAVFADFPGRTQPVAKLNPDGSLETDWWSGGRRTGQNYGNLQGDAKDVEVLPDGSLLVGLRHTSGTNSQVIERPSTLTKLRPDGTWDGDFNPGGGGPGGEVLEIAAAPDGKIVIVGNFRGYADGGEGSGNNRVTRLLSDGTADPYWNPGGEGQRGEVLTAAIDGDGNVFVGTDHTWYNGENRNRILKLVGDVLPLALLSQPESQILDLGETARFQAISFGTSAVSYQWRKDGVPLPGATQSALEIADVTDADDGSYDVVVTNATGGTLVSASGQLFTISYPKFITGPQDQAVASGDEVTFSVEAIGLGDLTYQWNFEGEPIAGATDSSYSIPFASLADMGYYSVAVSNSQGERLSEEASLLVEPFAGALDASFAAGAGFNGQVYDLLELEGGDVVVAGAFSQYRGEAAANLVKLNPDGRRDTIWPMAGSPGFTVRSVALDTEGRYLVGGAFSGSGDWSNALERLTAEGAVDDSFNSGGEGFSNNSAILDIAVQDDGKILALVDTTYNANPTYNGEPVKRLFRLNADGTIDDGFLQVETDAPPAGIYLLSSGKILMYGNFTTVNGEEWSRVARLNANGAVDSGFALSAGPDGMVQSVDEAADGSVVLGGSFQNVGGKSRRYLALLAPDGSLDEGFDTSVAGGSYPNGFVTGVSALLDGEFLVVGSFLGWGSSGQTLPYRIATVDRAGQRTGFTNGSHFAFSSNPGNTVIVDGAGYAYLGGGFTLYHGQSSGRIARIHLQDMDLVFLSQPEDQYVEAGQTAVFAAEALGSSTIGYQWYKDGTALPGEIGPTLEIEQVELSDEGRYWLRIVNASGQVDSVERELFLLGAPEVRQHPASRIVSSGAGASLVAEAIGAAPLTVQWYRNGTQLAGETGSTLRLEGALASDAGMYHAVFSNELGSMATRVAGVSVAYGPEGIDDAFTPAFTGSPSFTGVHKDAEGNYVTIGSFVISGLRHLAAFRNDGSLIPDLSAAAYPNNGFNASAAFASDGSLMYFDGSTLKRLRSGDYALDEAFNANVAAIGLGSLSQPRVEALSGGKALIVSRDGLERLNADGTLDDGFNAGGSGFGGGVPYLVTEAPDGRLAAFGDFTTYNGESVPGFAILDTDGSIDASFGYGDGFNGSLNFIQFGSDNKLYVAGDFSEYQGEACGAFVRLNPDGTRDGSFAPPAITRFSNAAYPNLVRVNGDGTVYIAGYFSHVGEAARGYIALLDADGSPLESRFGSGLNGQVADWVFESDGSITLVGSFYSPKNRVMRANAAPPALALAGSPDSQRVAEGESITLSAAASGEGPLEFAWSKDGTTLEGETGPTLTLASVDADAAGSYQVSVSNGGDPILAPAFELSVDLALAITQQPQSVVAGAGGSARFTVVAQGTGELTYQWLKDGVELAGETRSELLLASLDESDEGDYTARVSDDNGDLVSAAATLEVGPGLAITRQPTGGSYVAGEAVELSVAAEGAGVLSYQWYRDDSALTGETSPSLSIESFDEGDAGTYLVEVSNGTVTARSAMAELTLYVIRNQGLDTYLDALGIAREQRGFEDDADGDGQSNALEYLLGSDASDAGSRGALEARVARLGDADYLEIAFTRRAASSDLSIRVEVSADVGFGQVAAASLEQSVDQGDGTSRQRYRSVDPVGTDPMFARIVIE